MPTEDRPAYVRDWFEFSEAQRGAWGNLLDAHRIVTGRIDEVLRSEHELTLSEWDVLSNLGVSGDGGMTMSELSDNVQLSASGMTRLVTRLEERGLVERRRGEADARRRRVEVTAEGYDFLTEVSRTHAEALGEHFFSNLTETSCEQLADLLAIVLDPDGP